MDSVNVGKSQERDALLRSPSDGERTLDNALPARTAANRMDAAPLPLYAAAADGVLTPEGLRLACRRVWRDSNSSTMLGIDILNSEPVSWDDKEALLALKRHIQAAGPPAFLEDVLPKLGFGRVSDEVRAVSEPARQKTSMVNERSKLITCAKCGKEAEPLHRGCRLCEDCCDCRPAGT